MNESTNQIWTYIIPIIGLIIAAITAFGVFYGPKLVAKSQEKKEKLKKHFSDLQDGATKPLSDITANINIKNGLIINNSPQSFAHLDSEQLECFQAHYPIFADKWQELAGKWTKQKGLTGGRWTKHNEKVDSFENKVKEFMTRRLAEMGITLPIKPYQVRQEIISEMIVSTLLKTFYEEAQGQPVICDFGKATIIEDSDFYTIEVCGTKWATTKNRDTAEKCNSILIDIQNSLDFRKEASLTIEEAKQIKGEFEELLSNLDKIQSRGFISKDPKYKFQAVKKCHIYKELFY